MRSLPDRLRHALSFELSALVLLVAFGMLTLGLPADRMGLLGVLGTLLATAWTYLFNLGFDRALMRWRGSTRKTPALRLVNAVLFEAGLMLLGVPLIMACLGIGFAAALLLDLGMAGFYLLYALVFNWAYDRVFPLPEWQEAPA
ncbi:PACE efflux transporter [Roseivivax sp. CAU 1761]